jgi:hypothetical protein
VSYRIVFVPRPAGSSLESAMVAIDHEEVSGAERARWFDQLVPAAQSILGDVEADEAGRTVSHPASGLQLSVSGGGVVLRVPYEGEADPLALMTLAHALAGEVERVTRLVGWDPQLGEPVATRIGAVPSRPRPTAPPRDDEGARGGGGTLPPAEAPPEAPAAPRRRPWWRFWDRG